MLREFIIRIILKYCDAMATFLGESLQMLLDSLLVGYDYMWLPLLAQSNQFLFFYTER